MIDGWSKVSGMLGLAFRARQLVTGVDFAVEAARTGKARVLLLDTAASENTRKRLRDAATHFGVPLYELPEGLMDQATGKSGRMAGAVLKGSFAEPIQTLLMAAGNG
ncbi:MAG: hypothetical protein IJ240_02920 [Clostridia bacterium]|nr:hypothetical protein [Clostridia bacterium]